MNIKKGGLLSPLLIYIYSNNKNLRITLVITSNYEIGSPNFSINSFSTMFLSVKYA